MLQPRRRGRKRREFAPNTTSTLDKEMKAATGKDLGDTSTAETSPPTALVRRRRRRNPTP